jgi:hypothetical protein
MAAHPPHDHRVRDLLVELAEGATAGVAHHLRRGEGPLAAPLQRFAYAAWAGAHGDLAVPGVRAEAERALEALTQVTGARAPRRFLGGVLARLDDLAPPAPAPTPAFGGLDDLALLLQVRGPVSVRASQLRDAVGARRLDPLTRVRIELDLDARDIGCVPERLPPDGRAWVRVYPRSHPLGLLLAAAATPGPQGDRLVRVAVSLLAGADDA